jgi:hypothetical protein
MRDFPVVFIVSTSLADYYAVGAAKQITVSVRYSCGKYLCHTCCVNKCEHTEAVRKYRDEYGAPIEALPDTTDDLLAGVEL